MAKLGRPPRPVVQYTNEQLETAIDLAIKGEPLKVIIDAMLTTEYDFWKYCQVTQDFEISFTQARQAGLEHIADGLITAHKDEIDVQRARLKSDNAKWLLAKRKPSVYGDKVDIHVTQTIDISHALSEARSRSRDVIEVGMKKLESTKKDASENGDADGSGVDPFS